MSLESGILPREMDTGEAGAPPAGGAPNTGGARGVGSASMVGMDQVVEAVVRNAMERLIEKQDQRGQPAKDGARKRELARYFEETRRQLVSVLALLRWQQRRLKVTAKCEDLIDALEDHRAHMTMTAERMCVAAEESAHHRTPMYDMRTAVDVLAAGTYCGLPSMEVERTIAPKVEGDEKDAVIAQLDFQLRAELLRMHIPPELSRIEVRDGRLLLEAANEFELELSLRLELPPRPWRVDRLQLLVKAVGGPRPTCQGLAELLERRMSVVDRQNQLHEAVSVLGDAVRMRTWHILHGQSQQLLLFPKVEIEATTSSFLVYYWQDSPILSFERLMTTAVRASSAQQQQKQQSLAQSAPEGGSAGVALGGISAQVKIRAPCLVLTSNRDMHSRVQIKHLPALVQENGHILEIPIKRSALDLAAILDYAIKQHARCRLRLLLNCLQGEGAAKLNSAGIQPVLSESGHELVVQVDQVPRLSIVVDHRSGELEARDLELCGAGGASHDKLETGLHKALFKEADGAAAQALLTWRASDMLGIVTGLAPALGLRPAQRLLTYSHSQATQLQAIVGDKNPAIFLQLAGSSILDSGYSDDIKVMHKPSSRENWTVVVQCDPAARLYSYRLVVLSVSKVASSGNHKPVDSPHVFEIDPYENLGHGPLSGGGPAVAPWAARDGIGRAHPKRLKTAYDVNDKASMRHMTALELSRVIEVAAQRVNLLKLQRQLDTHSLSWRAARGVLLLALPCAPLQARELRLSLAPGNASMVAGGESGWTVEMRLTSSSLPNGVRPPHEVIAAPREGLGVELLDSFVHLREEPTDGDLCGSTLVFDFPCIHAESIRDLREAMQSVVLMARLTDEARPLIQQDTPLDSPTGMHALHGRVTVEAAGYTALVLRLVASGELVILRCTAKGGLLVTIGHDDSVQHPLAAHIEVALDAGKSLASVLVSLVMAQPVLSAVAALKATVGDLTVLGYALDGLTVVFRGCFALHIRWAPDTVGEQAVAYSVGDLCPYAPHRAVPQGLDSSFMPHAKHSGGSISALADTLWCVPAWKQLVAAAAQCLSLPHENDTAGTEVSGSQVAAGNDDRRVSALGHVTDNRSALVCLAPQLPQLMDIFHRHLAAWHLFHMGNMMMLKVRPAAAGAKVAEACVTAGRHVFALEVLPPPSLLQNAQTVRLRLKANAMDTPPAGSEAIGAQHLDFLQTLFDQHVAAPPFAPNRLRSFVQLLSFPPSVLNSICALMQQLPTVDAAQACVALVPAFVLEGTHGKDTTRRPPMPPVNRGNPVRGPLVIAPRSEAASGFLHDTAAEEAVFVMRLLIGQAPAVEVQLLYAYGQQNNTLCATSVHQLSHDGAILANKAAAALAQPVVVPNRDLWAVLKGVLADLASS